MKPFGPFRGIVCPIDGVDINTDQILPGRFMQKPRIAYGQYFFFDLLRKARAGEIDLHLAKPEYAGAKILVCDENFGCGSSREQAVHAVADFGIRVVIAPSIGEIFSTNCSKNGVLTITLPREQVRTLREAAIQRPGSSLFIDLDNQVLQSEDGIPMTFSVDPFVKECLVRGIDEIDLTLSIESEIGDFEQQHNPRKHKDNR